MNGDMQSESTHLHLCRNGLACGGKPDCVSSPLIGAEMCVYPMLNRTA
jgi:hypothetical protein